MRQTRKVDLVNCMCRFELGKMDDEEEVEFFQYLIDSRLIYQLQGFYQRHAERMIRENRIARRYDWGSAA